MTEGKPAGFWVRYAAHTIDVVIFALISVVALFVLGGLHGLFGLSDRAMGFLFLLMCLTLWGANWIYYFLWHWNGGQTLGKRWLGLMVIGEEHTQLTFRQANVRWLAYHLSYLTLGIGFVIAIFREGKRGLHDDIAKTKVIHADPRRFWLEILTVVVFGSLPIFLPLLVLSTAASTYNYYFTVQEDLVEIETRNSLGALRESIRRYRDDNGSFPVEIDGDALLGKLGYVAEFPSIYLPHKGHMETFDVVRGPRVVADSARWVYDPDKGDIFIDCSHTDVQGTTIYSW